jgi:hypothetical protein
MILLYSNRRCWEWQCQRRTTTINIVVTPVNAGPLSIDASGNLTVAQTHQVVPILFYEICQQEWHLQIATATVTVVINNLITANNR